MLRYDYVNEAAYQEGYNAPVDPPVPNPYPWASREFSAWDAGRHQRIEEHRDRNRR